MQSLRDLTRTSLARSLRTLAEEDRLSMALAAVCGSAMAAHCRVGHMEEDGTLHLILDEAQWLKPLVAMKDTLQHDLQRVAGVPLAALHFELARTPNGEAGNLGRLLPGLKPADWRARPGAPRPKGKGDQR